MQTEVECLYCGRRWEHYRNQYSHQNLRCPSCGERKMLKQHEVDAQKGDVYGYRFGPPRPATKKESWE